MYVLLVIIVSKHVYLSLTIRNISIGKYVYDFASYPVVAGERKDVRESGI